MPAHFIGPDLPPSSSELPSDEDEPDHITKQQMRMVQLNENIVVRKLMKDLNKSIKYIDDTNWMFKNNM